ncbi:MAG TPA: long-chain fatty acid--CoA ligase [Solirubrobacteraceae bacterium]|nr:long-chain fatty acid--CoA ligase [Solirubrobacteraceae bacterium]
MEGTTVTPAGERAIDAATMIEAFHRTTRAHPDIVAVRTRDDETSITWGQLRERADALAGGLAKLGVGRGETVALLFGNVPEFHLSDLAVMTVGATPFSIYQTYTPEQIRYVTSDADARVAIVQPQFVANVLEARRELPDLEHVVVAGGDAPQGTIALSELEGSDPDFDAEAAAAGVQPDDVLTLIYTSGTTGPPKGVQLSHRNIMSVVESLEEIIQLPEAGTKVISWLPSAHVAERNAHHYIPIVFAGTITCCENPREILEYLPVVRPSWFFAVPRIWEKLKAGLETMLAAQPEEQRRQVEEALEAAREKVRLEQAGEPVPEALAARVAAADEEMFSGLRAHLGLDQVLAVNVGAAPTPPEVLEFFHAIGIELAEIWGMSETTGAGTANRPGAVKIGTVGPAAPGIEVKLADDGEVMVRGDCNMLGYRNQPEKTTETIDSEGWLHTGDVGEIDHDGYLRIVDRKKELIINAAGKNMSPANIEAALKSSSPLVGQACAIGDRRPYNTALIVLDADFAPAWAGQQGISDTSLEALAADEKVRAAVQDGMDTANRKLARVEQIKKFTIIPGDWHPDGDELTPTMKLKRRPIAEKYAAEIEAMYS